MEKARGRKPRYYCYRCGNVWTSEEEPRFCPRCKTSMWNVPISKEARCQFCGHEWTLTKMCEPCPECGHMNYDNRDPNVLHCNQCDHIWVKRTDGLPTRCPACRSEKWNEPRSHQYTCRRCGHVWRNRTGKPKKCPACQSVQWDEPVYRLQCRRCGYKWTTREGRSSEDVAMCPRCKSRKWNEVPEIRVCPVCGRSFMTRSRSEDVRCPACCSRNVVRNKCTFCGLEWDSSMDSETCPRCGKEYDRSGNSFEFWSDGGRSLRYVFTDGMAFVYLWDGDFPVATAYFHEILQDLGITASQAKLMFGDPDYTSTWKRLADRMYDTSEEWMEDIPYLSKRLNISDTDARNLAIHFTGMGPEAISVRFGTTLEEVRRSFDRIMRAFVDSGIVVDDTIFTDDAMSKY